MANVKVEIKVNTAATSKLFICGSSKNLGSWDASKAEEMTKENGVFTLSKMFTAGEMVEFKFLSKKDWANVEKNEYDQDVTNHIIVPSKGLVVNIDICKFGK